MIYSPPPLTGDDGNVDCERNIYDTNTLFSLSLLLELEEDAVRYNYYVLYLTVHKGRWTDWNETLELFD